MYVQHRVTCLNIDFDTFYVYLLFVLVVFNLFYIVWVSFLFFKVYWSRSSYLHRVVDVIFKISGIALSLRKNYLKVELVHILYLITLSYVYFVLHFF